MLRLAALAGVAALSACSTVDWNGELATTRAQIEQLDLLESTDLAIDEAYRDKPFDSGTVYVVANEHGDLHTYSLTPCRGGTHICGGAGQVGHVTRTQDYFVVTGAYRGRTFYLSPGGDGYLTWRGVDRDLAWN